MAVREQLSGGQVKGSLLRTRLSFAAERGGPEIRQRLIDALPPKLRASFDRPVLASAWYPFELVVALDRGLDAELGHGNRALLRELGAFSARVNLAGGYQAFRGEDLHAFFRKSAALHALFQDFGRMEYERLSEHGALITISDAVCYSITYCASALGYFDEVARLHRGSNPRSSHVSCVCEGAKDCVFRIEWS